MQLQCTVSRQKKMGMVSSRQPPDLIDFLLDLQTFEIIKLWFVTLEGTVHVVFAATYFTVFALWKRLQMHTCYNTTQTYAYVQYNIRKTATVSTTIMIKGPKGQENGR